MDQLPELPRTELPPVEVTNIETGIDTISFDVSEPGVPVLVKTNYFPNWEVDGADGPYRVTPNLMVVIPTEDHVSLHYGRTPVDLAALGLTLLGLIGLVWLARRPAIEVPADRPGRLSAWIDRLLTIDPAPRPPAGNAGSSSADGAAPLDDPPTEADPPSDGGGWHDDIWVHDAPPSET